MIVMLRPIVHGRTRLRHPTPVALKIRQQKIAQIYAVGFEIALNLSHVLREVADCGLHNVVVYFFLAVSGKRDRNDVIRVSKLCTSDIKLCNSSGDNEYVLVTVKIRTEIVG